MAEENMVAGVESIPGRKEKRYPANAQVRMRQSELVLKDVSLSGGCIRSEEFMEIVPNGTYTIVVIPEEESKVETFEVNILSRWVRMKSNGSESGFIMVIPPGSKLLENYIAYLKSKNFDPSEDRTCTED